MKVILLVMCLNLPLLSAAQGFYLKIPELINDNTTITHIIDSMKHIGTLSTYLVYQREAGNRVISYLLYDKGMSVYMWVISQDSVCESRQLNKQGIFSYRSIAATGASKYEDRLEFKPPLLSVVNNEVVIYCSTKTKLNFFFEYGDNVTMYQPLLKKDVYRKRWLEIIRKDLL